MSKQYLVKALEYAIDVCEVKTHDEDGGLLVYLSDLPAGDWVAQVSEDGKTLYLRFLVDTYYGEDADAEDFGKVYTAVPWEVWGGDKILAAMPPPDNKEINCLIDNEKGHFITHWLSWNLEP